MKKVLLISQYPYSKTARGMDVLTECFEELNWDTSHLTFPNVFYTVKKTKPFPTTVKEYIARKAIIPYVDSLMRWFPKPLFTMMLSYQKRKTSFIDFAAYDYIVVESGKPLFLLDSIPESIKIIYRQSDSVRHILGKNKYYIGLEDKILHKAEKIIVVKERYKKLLDEKFHKKVQVIRNGLSIPENIKLTNPYQGNSTNAVYVGIKMLDVKTLKEICLKNPNLKVHIFGTCLTKLDLLRLRKIKNFFYYGFQPREKYLPFIKYADVAICPYKDWYGMKAGFTTKYLNFMYFKLPIVSYSAGQESEFAGMGVYFVSGAEEFADKVSQIIRSKEKVNLKIDFNFFSHNERKKEYRQLINSLDISS